MQIWYVYLPAEERNTTVPRKFKADHYSTPFASTPNMQIHEFSLDSNFQISTEIVRAPKMNWMGCEKSKRVVNPQERKRRETFEKYRRDHQNLVEERDAESSEERLGRMRFSLFQSQGVCLCRMFTAKQTG